MDRRVENLLNKAAHLRHSAAATFWLDYREKMLRVARELMDEEFGTHVFKWVRKGHVQTTEHWSRNWRRI